MSNLQTLNSFPTAQEFQTMKDLGEMAVKSGFLPTSIKTSEQAIIIMLKGKEIGIPPMQAFSSIAVVSGKPTMSAELMLSMIYRNVSGAIVDFIKTDSSECVIEAKRPNGKRTKFSFTMKDAETAGLTEKPGPWKQYPAAMLRARCISSMARAMFPDALSGIVYTPEELGAEVDGDGEILNIKDATPVQVAIVAPNESLPPEADATEKIDAIAVLDSEIGDYEIRMGKHKGKKLSDMDINELESYRKWLVDNARQKQQALTGVYKEFAENANAFLKSREFAR